MKKLDLFVIGCLLIALFYGFIFAEKSYLNQKQVAGRLRTLSEQIEELKEENEKLAHEIKQLSTNKAYIEKKAREYGLIKQGEVEIK